MKKNLKSYGLVWIIAVVMFNALAFIVPRERDGSFLVGVIFINAAFVLHLVCWHFTSRERSAERFFYKISLLRVSHIGLWVMSVAGWAVMLIEDIPYSVGIAVCIIVLGVTAIWAVMADTAAEIVADQDVRIAQKTAVIAELRAEAEAIRARATTPEISETCTKVYDALRYSDPVSHSALEALESSIRAKLEAMREAVASSDAVGVKGHAEELLLLISERNIKCKALKNRGKK